MTTTVQLPKSLVEKIVQLAKAAPEQEICGLIGHCDEHYECYPIDNMAIDTSVLFALNASEQIAAFKTMQASGQDFFAIYHSHPHASAWPSNIDIEAAEYPEVLNLIVSLNMPDDFEIRGFYLRAKTVEEVELIL